MSGSRTNYAAAALHLEHHHQHHHQHHYHADGPTTTAASAPALAPTPPPPTLTDLEAANVAHFDALSHNFDSQHPFAANFADRLARALHQRSASSSSSSYGDSGGASSNPNSSSSSSSFVLDEDATSVLDYACGSGQVSRALAPYVAQLVGVDISPRMVEVYNTRANTQGLEPHEMRAVNSLAELHQEQCFDLAVCSMAYHHFASVEQITRELVTYLKPRGTLAVADIARMPGDTEEAAAPPVIPAQYEHIVAHTRGFAEEEMRALFEGPGGLENFSFELFTSAKREGRDIHFFLATGTKPAQSQ
jgi:2-polyprenyl-3-methyl-5-hydroxy-6-metoxy-1,4-benzoquinol methylase